MAMRNEAMTITTEQLDLLRNVSRNSDLDRIDEALAILPMLLDEREALRTALQNACEALDPDMGVSATIRWKHMAAGLRVLEESKKLPQAASVDPDRVRIGGCETCGVDVYEGDTYYDWDDGVCTCATCGGPTPDQIAAAEAEAKADSAEVTP
jgi:hypothetical protein